jgi:hypothetical protein
VNIYISVDPGIVYPFKVFIPVRVWCYWEHVKVI